MGMLPQKLVIEYKKGIKKPGRGLDWPRPGHMILWIWQFCRHRIGIVTATPLLTG